MITWGADSHNVYGEAPETGSAFEETGEIFSWFPDWPLLCGCLRLREGSVGSTARQEAKELLATALWRKLDGLADEGRRPLFTAGDVTTGGLGRPLLVVAGRRIANVSFSYGNGEAWAVVCRPSRSCGIDVAGRKEFGSEYPYQRVFSSAELSSGSEMTCGEPEETAALLWSAKEAVVKAFGWGFHFLEPIDVSLEPTVRRGTGCEMRARLTGRWRSTFSRFGDVHACVRTVRVRDCWVSVAMIESELTGGGQL